GEGPGAAAPRHLGQLRPGAPGSDRRDLPRPRGARPGDCRRARPAPGDAVPAPAALLGRGRRGPPGRSDTHAGAPGAQGRPLQAPTLLTRGLQVSRDSVASTTPDDTTRRTADSRRCTTPVWDRSRCNVAAPVIGRTVSAR